MNKQPAAMQAVLAAATVCLAPLSAQAQDAAPEGIQLRAVAGLEHESNVLRTQSNPVSDTAAVLGVGLRVDRTLGLQRLHADLEADSYRYSGDHALDYNLFNYALAWDWSLTPRFHGVLSADRRQYREVLTDPVLLVNRLSRRTERTELAEGVFEAGAALRLSASLTHTSAQDSQPGSWDASPDVTSERVGIGYELPSGSSLYARFRRGRGEYTDPAAGAPSGDFRENEADLVLHWPVSGRTAIDARVGRLARMHDAGSASDFSGMVGSAAMNWQVTAKTRLAAGVNRDLGGSGLATGGRVRSDRIFIGPTWNATTALALHVRYDYVARDWQDVPAGSPESGRKDTVRVPSAGVEWQPRRWAEVSGYVRREQQESNLDTGYRNTTVGAAVKTLF